MKWVRIFFNWLKSLIGKFMKMGSSGNAAGNFSSKTKVEIIKEVHLDDDGNEIPNTVVYRIIDSYGNIKKESPSLKEIFHWLEVNKLTHTIK